MDNPYADMLTLPRPVSETHAPMSRLDRAAQFSPFAALTGYEEAVEETARLTLDRIELDESQKAALDQKLRRLLASGNPAVCVTHFVADERKPGGAYVTVTGRVKRLDTRSGSLLLEDGGRIWIEDILHVTAPQD